MKKSKISRLAAAVLTAAMVVTMGGMSAFAEEADTQNVTFEKKIIKAENVYTPALDKIDFTVEPGNGGKDKGGYVVYDGIPGGVTFDSGASFAVNDKLEASSVSGTVTLKINKDKFYDESDNFKPGIYRYEVKETDPGYDGLKADDRTYFLDVYVSEETVDNVPVKTFNSYMYVSTDSNASKVTEIDNEYTTHDLTVQKFVSGNQGDVNKEFTFDITIYGAAGESYYVVKNDTALDPWVCGNDQSVSQKVTLKHGDIIRIKGLSAEDKYEVKEIDDASDSYTTTIKGADKISGLVATGVVRNSDHTVVYTNTKDVTPPTGIVLSFAPYILLVAFAGVFAVLFLRKKREDEI